jgi:integrase/recombinase XerD
VRFLSKHGIGDLALVRLADLRRFLAAEAERRPALGSQARTVAGLKGFFRFLVESEYLERDPTLVLRTPKKRKALPDVLDRRELARLLEAAERDEVWQKRHAGKRERDGQCTKSWHPTRVS